MKSAILIILSIFNIEIASAGGGGSGWTQCYVDDLGLAYSFPGYTQSLKVGSMITVFPTDAKKHQYGDYQITAIDLSRDIGEILLKHLPSDDTNNSSKDTNFGDMKIEYYSNSAIKDLKVTFTDGAISHAGDASCFTD